jgi:hypothetical protein
MSPCDPLNFVLFILCFFMLGFGFWLGIKVASGRTHDWGEHYKALFERASHERDWYKGLLFDAWKTMRGQTKGLQRQRLLIKRLQRELATADKSSVTPQVEQGDSA